jgi:hypothetical protein
MLQREQPHPHNRGDDRSRQRHQQHVAEPRSRCTRRRTRTAAPGWCPARPIARASRIGAHRTAPGI